MPRVIDTSYNEILSRPAYYDETQKEEYLQKRIMNEILEDSTPPLPNRQQELDYLKELEDEFRADRWLHLRYRKLQAGPLRRPYKHARELKKIGMIDYATTFLIGGLLFLPIGVFVGRRLRTTAMGVPKVYFPRNYNRLPYNDPDGMSRRYFRIGLYGTTILAGFFIAGFWTPDHFKDEYFSRPDLKPSAPMVEDDDQIARAKKQLYQTEYFVKDKDLQKRSLMHRLFRPNTADYNIRYPDRRVEDTPQNSYDPVVGGFPSEKDLHDNHW